MNNSVIKVDGVSKKYCQTLRHTMSYGVKDLACSFLGISQQSEQLRPGEFWAVNDVSFEVKPGETVGIVGSNGSGKSTILKMLNGIFMPDMGRIEITGRVGALIEVGAGFHPMLTGRENIYVNGAILGMAKKQIDKKLDEIIYFSGIEEFIDSPVKHYSSGMYVRLGFAVAVHCDPDILLVDEILAVGDASFQYKCYQKLQEFKKSGKAIIIVTHDMDVVVKHCDFSLLLNKGRVTTVGKPSDVVNQYMDIVEGREKVTRYNITKSDTYFSGIGTTSETSSYEGFIQEVITTDNCVYRRSYNKNEYRQLSNSGKILDYLIVCGDNYDPVSVFSGDVIDIYIKAKMLEKIYKPLIGFVIKSLEGVKVFGVNNTYTNLNIKPFEINEVVVFKVTVQLNLQSGSYFIDIGFAEQNETENSYDVIDRRCDLININVKRKNIFDGLVLLDVSMAEVSRTLLT